MQHLPNNSNHYQRAALANILKLTRKISIDPIEKRWQQRKPLDSADHDDRQTERKPVLLLSAE
ncbi:hypothetical protein [Vibrio cincinnatiensis]|uniref:hypothetical protein n=1 Tax=Vibrio cincinnatiensis TaxID=675 RepID=UPI001EDF3D56|nr:hypothetical protein [Vibrio cincinnatiensis]MCG3734764.1 hypothetical protein [Vibrio cincinnatiensis]MCG3741846.1 hypothetical protein [Vibrio cincinnatiensis]